MPIAATLRDYLDQHLLAVEWSEGLVFGASAVSPFSPTPVRDRAYAAWGWSRVRMRGAGDNWRKARPDALERITMHECRHTFASLMIAAGANAKALSTYMGHSTVAFTLDKYGHLMPGNEDEAAGKLDAYLARASEQAQLAPVPRQSSPDEAGFGRTLSEQRPR